MKKVKATFEIDLNNKEEMTDLRDFLTKQLGGKAKPTEELEEEEEEEETDITIEELRDLTKEKAANTALRPKIKDKLKVLGASAVSDLDEKHYAAYKTFIEKLK